MTRIKTGFGGQSTAEKLLYFICRTIVCGATRLYTRMTIEGLEHLPASGGYILAPVHRSYVDTPITACLTRRRIRFMGKDTMWKISWFGKLISALGAFPVTRGTADREALKRCVAVLEGAEPLVLFPEGERKDGPTVQPLFDGAAFVAAKSGVPIVPVGIGGSARVMPRGARFVFPAKVHVVVGEPISVAVNDRGRASRVAITEATSELHDSLQRLYDRAMSVVG